MIFILETNNIINSFEKIQTLSEIKIQNTKAINKTLDH